MLTKVSIIMPSLNVADYIEECIKSAVAQTLKEIEILCIDAGSTDGTLDILQKYANMDSRIRLIHSDRRSYGYQVNLGIKMAQGEYVAILETDDYVDFQMYEILYHKAKEYNLDYVNADFNRVQKIGEKVFIETNRMFANDGWYDRVVVAGELPYVYTKDLNIWSGIYKKSFLERYTIRLNETSGAAFQDIGFKLQVFTYAEKMMYIKYSGYHYRMERDGCSTCSDKVLKYSWQEFENLLKKPDILESGVFRYVLLRMVQVFVCEYNKLLVKYRERFFETDFYEEYIEPYYKWFSDKIVQCIHKGLISMDSLEQRDYDTLMLLIKDEREYCNRKIECEIEAELYWNDLVQKISEAEVVIVGCGIRGKVIFRELALRKCRIVAVCDNDTDKWGENIADIPIESVEAVTKKYKNAIYIISSKKYEGEFRKQLIEMGIQKSQFMIYTR